ncbi:MAG: bifunctional nuclease family protein [Patescibacteria group bacterium]|nr:bifunctional nuclease family protein [Patescibacteria group bacterium]
MEKIKIGIVTVIKAPHLVSPVIALKEKDGERYLLIPIGFFDAQAVIRTFRKIKTRLPLTHELMSNIIKKLNLSVKEVIITNVTEDDFFRADICIDSFKIDARPSDAIILALHFDAPIFIAETLMEQKGIILTAENTPTTQNKEITSEPILERPQARLDKAVENEDYEKAAQLRDEIKKLTSSHN